MFFYLFVKIEIGKRHINCVQNINDMYDFGLGFFLIFINSNTCERNLLFYFTWHHTIKYTHILLIRINK